MLQVVQQSATRESRFAERSLDVASGTMKLARLLGRGGVNEGIDDPTILQLNDRSSELPFCCKRGHSAILPPHSNSNLQSVASDGSRTWRRPGMAISSE